MLETTVLLVAVSACLAVLQTRALRGYAIVAHRLILSRLGGLHCSLLQNLVACCTAHQRRHAKGHDLTCPADLHLQVLLRHAGTMQGSLSEGISCPAGGVPSLPAADADGALPQRQEGSEQEAVEDQALPAILCRPHLLTLQLPADAQQQRLRSTQRAGKASSDARLCLQNSTAPSRDRKRIIMPQWLATIHNLWAGRKILTSHRNYPAKTSSCNSCWCMHMSIQKPAMSSPLLQSLLRCS